MAEFFESVMEKSIDTSDPAAGVAEQSENMTVEDAQIQRTKQSSSRTTDPAVGEKELILPGTSEDREDTGMDTVDSESTTSVSTIECPEEDLERYRRLSSSPPKQQKSRMATPSPNSTTSVVSIKQTSRASSVSTSPSGRQSPAGGSSSSTAAFPVRPGITWRVRSKVEAMDFLQKWYPARIVEINAANREVLIHFEGWNARYDEWVEMKSERIRPLARHSERKEYKKAPNKAEHKVGECVFAKWTDCRHYAARVLTINPSGSYEVIFFDGFKKTVQPINVKVMLPEVQVEYANAGLLPPHPKSLTKHTREPPGEIQQKTTPEPKHARKSSSGSDITLRDTPKQRERKTSTPKGSHKIPSSQKKKKSFVVGAVSIKKEKMDEHTPEQAAEVEQAPEPTSETPSDVPSSSGTSTLDPCPEVALAAPPSSEEGKDLGSPEGNEGTSEGIQGSSEVTAAPVPSSSTHGDNLVTSSPLPSGSGSAPLTLLPPNHDFAAVATFPKTLLPLQPPKAFRVEEDHNRYKCPFEGCNKGFRKETLLEYHLKYYHMEDGKPIPPPPPRKRKKTSSICSTDSEISVGGRSTSSKRRKRLSEASQGSIPDAVFDRLALQIEDSVGTELMDDSLLSMSVMEVEVKEESTGADDLVLGEEASIPISSEEVVNCICQLNEENGLMIQCEVCLCWQHASCMELTMETLPKRYVCYVCANPPGIRDSARYMYVQDWFKDGKLASFNFLPPAAKAEERAARAQTCHNTVGEMHGVTRVLDSLRRKIHILQEKNHPEFHFWTKNWDRVIEKRKQEEESLLKRVKCEAAAAADPDNFVVNVDTDDHINVIIKTEENNGDPIIENGGLFELVTESMISNPVIKQESVESSEVPEEVDMSGSIDVENDDDRTISVDASPSSGVVVPSSVGVAPSSDEVDQSSGGVAQSSGTVARSSGVGAPSSGLHDYSMVTRHDEGRQIQLHGLDMEGGDELESDVSLMGTGEEEDPGANCERNLLEHIMNMQDKVAGRLDLIEEHVAALEALEDRPAAPKDILADVPILKRKVHSLLNDLLRVKRMSRFH